MSIKGGGEFMDFSILREIAQMQSDLPKKLAALSEKNPNIAIQILQSWGKGEKPVRDLWKEVNVALDQCA